MAHMNFNKLQDSLEHMFGTRVEEITFDQHYDESIMTIKLTLNPHLTRKLANPEWSFRGYKPLIRVFDECMYSKPEIKKVIFNNPATIVYWTDGTKTVVKCGLDEFDSEKGLAMAISKKMLGNQGNYYETFKKWLPEPEEEIYSNALDAMAAYVTNIANGISNFKKMQEKK